MAKTVSPVRVGLIHELPPRGGRLGRHIEFDERSRAYAVARPKKAAPLVTREWVRKSAPYDQGDTGSCTGNGAAGLLVTAPFTRPRRHITQKLARKIYSEASKLDSIQGEWPPNDTGSSVLAAMKALVKLQYAKSYHWCFGIDDALATLSNVGPIEVGVNWYDGFDSPDMLGHVSISGRIRGGHAFEVLGIDVERKTVTAVNSWGKSFGWKGRFTFSWADFDRLLQEDGEAATIVV